MTVLRACVKCGKPSRESFCPAHKPKPWAGSRRRERVTVSGWEQQRRAKRIMARYLGCCHWCGNPGATEIDHRIPLAEGGADEEWNLAPVHAACHRKKTQAEAARARTRGGDDPRKNDAHGTSEVADRARQNDPEGG